MYASWNARAVGVSLPASDTVEIAARAGFQGVDLLVRDLVESGEDPCRLRDRMDALGLRGGAWPLPMNWRHGELAFTEDLSRLPLYAQVAAELGLMRTGTWVLPAASMEQFPGRNDAEILRQAVEMHLDRLGRIAMVLAEHNVQLGLEIMGPATARQGRGMIFIDSYRRLSDRLGRLRERHPNVGLLVDAFHLFASGDGVETGLIWGVDRVVWVHLADPARSDRNVLLDHERDLPSRTGMGRCRDLLESLGRDEYAGPITVEPLSQCGALAGLDANAAARKVKAALSSVWPE